MQLTTPSSAIGLPSGTAIGRVAFRDSNFELRVTHVVGATEGYASFRDAMASATHLSAGVQNAAVAVVELDGRFWTQAVEGARQLTTEPTPREPFLAFTYLEELAGTPTAELVIDAPTHPNLRAIVDGIVRMLPR